MGTFTPALAAGMGIRHILRAQVGIHPLPKMGKNEVRLSKFTSDLMKLDPIIICLLLMSDKKSIFLALSLCEMHGEFLNIFTNNSSVSKLKMMILQFLS